MESQQYDEEAGVANPPQDAPITSLPRMKPGMKLFIVTGVLSIILFTSCIITGVVVALLRNNLTNIASDYALKHVFLPLAAIFAASLVLMVAAYFRYRSLNQPKSTQEEEHEVKDDDTGTSSDDS
ncbi:hypothetical protein BWQ96_03441 [Gracilariopsis chorda]|uniref:Uncharacterized protein n=1 Tax=Gracilariopsis chorda TaxID=448386 RepID=A0A2V3J064_9FLOR|nr:hypothetical protein BWQ96_03441 [Gracilariopsis chorda]|eukprot:PXF46750.1 hypothetical protein BWQ96_03441 [Gracilariopsis chorda]